MPNPEVKLKPCEWQMVPKEPTEEMISGAFAPGIADLDAADIQSIWATMLLAAPSPPTQDHRERAREIVHRWHSTPSMSPIPQLREMIAAALSEAEAPLRQLVEARNDGEPVSVGDKVIVETKNGEAVITVWGIVDGVPPFETKAIKGLAPVEDQSEGDAAA